MPMPVYPFKGEVKHHEDEYYEGALPLYQGDDDESVFQEIYEIFLRPFLKPLIALGIAYGYVLSGKKVEEPLNWNEI